MAKKERGLPEGFGISLPDAPVQPGDYIDEEMAAPAPPQPPEPAAPVQPAPPEPPPPAPERTAWRSGTVPRKQINLTPETLRMVEELVIQARAYSLEKDIRASELFHALVLCVWEARTQLDLSGVQPRGRWGSPTAAALPVALKNAFQEAIAQLLRSRE